MRHHRPGCPAAESRLAEDIRHQIHPQIGEQPVDRDYAVVPVRLRHVPGAAVVVPVLAFCHVVLAVPWLGVELHYRGEGREGGRAQIQLRAREISGKAAYVKSPERHSRQAQRQACDELSPQL